MTGTHVVEECPELDQWRPHKAVWKEWREALGGRAASKKNKEDEEEGDRLGAFFYRIYEFLFTFSNPPPVIHRPHVPERYTIKFTPAAVQSVNSVSRSASPVISSHVFVPAELPARYAIAFVPAVSAFAASGYVPFVPAVSASASVPSSDYSVVSSVNFVIPTTCIESNP